MKKEELALYGCTPVFTADAPLSGVMPRHINEKAWQYVKEVLDSGFDSDYTQRFENEFARLHNVKYALSVANCTAAVHVALAALNIGAGDHVVTTPISDFGTYAGIFAQNALPVFADIDPDTGCVNAQTIEKVITPYTKAILVVHWHGLIIDMDPIVSLSRRTGIPIIEDCCQCPLGEYKGQKAGTFGVFGCFSTDAEKHLSTEHGGLVVTNDKGLYDKAYQYAIMRGAYVEPGYGRKYNMLGLNYRFGQMEGAVGLAQLETLPMLNANRKRTCKMIADTVNKLDGILPLKVPEGSECLYWIYPVIFDMSRFSTDIRTLGAALNAEGITGCSHIPYYLITDGYEPMIKQHGLYGDTACVFDCPYQKVKMNYTGLDLPGARTYVSRTVRWVICDRYTDKDVAKIIEAVTKVVNYFHK